jgi:hypothetical protein
LLPALSYLVVVVRVVALSLIKLLSAFTAAGIKSVIIAIVEAAMAEKSFIIRFRFEVVSLGHLHHYRSDSY